MKKQWKWIKGLEGLYQISNTGEIKSFRYCKSGRIHKVKDASGEYLKTAIQINHKKIHIKIHRCVYETFRGEIPPKFHIHHIDGNKQNNRLDNLSLISEHEHMVLEGKKQSHYLGMTLHSKYSQKHLMQFDVNGKFIGEYINAVEASKAVGLKTSDCILDAAHGRSKTSGGYIWKFKGEEVI